MNKRLSMRLAAGFLALGLVAAACGDDTETSSSTKATGATAAATGASAAATKDIVDTAVAGKFTILAEALTTAGLVDALKAPGPFTVFAPTDEAFAAALKSLNVTKEQLFADKTKLAAILKYHVVAGKVPAAEVVKLDGKTATTLNGATVKIAVSGGTVTLNGDTKVTATDVMASNGVIHVIDKGLLPPA